MRLNWLPLLAVEVCSISRFPKYHSRTYPCIVWRLRKSKQWCIFCVSLQVFANEVNGHRDHIINLDQTGNQLKFLSQKQDVVLIKNLLVSVQSRWEKVVQRSVERGRALDDARKRAKQVRHLAHLMVGRQQHNSLASRGKELIPKPAKQPCSYFHHGCFTLLETGTLGTVHKYGQRCS